MSCGVWASADCGSAGAAGFCCGAPLGAAGVPFAAGALGCAGAGVCAKAAEPIEIATNDVRMVTTAQASDRADPDAIRTFMIESLCSPFPGPRWLNGHPLF